MWVLKKEVYALPYFESRYLFPIFLTKAALNCSRSVQATYSKLYAARENQQIIFNKAKLLGHCFIQHKCIN